MISDATARGAFGGDVDVSDERHEFKPKISETTLARCSKSYEKLIIVQGVVSFNDSGFLKRCPHTSRGIITQHSRVLPAAVNNGALR